MPETPTEIEIPSKLVQFDIGHPRFEALIEPDSAFWSLVEKGRSASIQSDPELISQIRASLDSFDREMRRLRFELTPSAVYFNPTERCNLNCTYCYLPEQIRRHGLHMPKDDLFRALEMLLEFFHQNMAEGHKPQVIFHGSEPMLNKESVFAAIERFGDQFIFGIQTNGTLLDDEAIEFITGNRVSLGLSLDGPSAQITDRTRHTFSGLSVHDRVLDAMERLRGYQNYSVITTVTTENLAHLSEIVELFHSMEVPTCMLNQVRCTMPGSRELRPEDEPFADRYIRALERTHQLYLESGRKLVVANFANILLSIVAPTARRLMCDISPCGGGRCFFAIDARGEIFPCSEFIGLKDFGGGNIFNSGLESCLYTESFKSVTGRMIEKIEECDTCPVRHFCGAPCPAEAHQIHGTIDSRGAFCDFYKSQAKYAFRLIADGIENDFLWDDWDKGLPTVFEMSID